jgi:hypothetical protein
VSAVVRGTNSATTPAAQAPQAATATVAATGPDLPWSASENDGAATRARRNHSTRAGHAPSSSTLVTRGDLPTQRAGRYSMVQGETCPDPGSGAGAGQAPEVSKC